MRAISATNSRLKLTTLLSRAQQEPLIIRHNHQDMAVMLSAAEYRRLSRRRPAGIDPKLAAMIDACD
jgi:PHD/YefM family antitoxin component YafN of YafNO toxin-antitoxin module